MRSPCRQAASAVNVSMGRYCVLSNVPDGESHLAARLPHHPLLGSWRDVSDVTCSAGDCPKPVSKRNLCAGHYKRSLAGKPLDTPIRAKRAKGETPAPCSFPDCGRPVKYLKLCKTHYECFRMGKPLVPIRDLTPRAGTCSAGDCDREIWARGLCGAHYVRDYLRAQSDRPIRKRGPRAPRVRAECSAPDCDRKVQASGLCGAHYARQYYDVPMDQPIRRRRRKGEPPAVCSADDCGKLAKGGFGLCKTHWAAQTGKGAEYSARRRSRKFDGPHDRITAADHRALRAATADCYLCGEPLADPVEFDHVIPLSRGGRHVLANLAPVHRHCNRIKYTALPDEFAQALVREEVMS